MYIFIAVVDVQFVQTLLFLKDVEIILQINRWLFWDCMIFVAYVSLFASIVANSILFLFWLLGGGCLIDFCSVTTELQALCPFDCSLQI